MNGKITPGQDGAEKLQQRVTKLNSMFRHVTHIMPRDVRKLQEERGMEGVVLADCRMSEEIAVSRLPGRCISEAEFERQLPAIVKEQPVVVAYCTIGYRSSKFVEKYADRTDLEIYNLSGGILQWVVDGYPVVDAQQKPVLDVHTFSKSYAGHLPDVYTSHTFTMPLASYMISKLKSVWWSSSSE